jgi:prolipoprotein diacylglyceryltransferase
MDQLINQLPPQSVWIGFGLLLCAAIAAGTARRIGVSWLDVLSLFAACVLIGGAASRVSWALLDPSVSWSWFLDQGLAAFDPRRGGHSSFGAMAGGLTVVGVWWFAAKRSAEHTRGSMLDALVLGGLAGLGMARIGCLANGCDFGRRMALSWGVRYRPGTEAYLEHLAHGLIAPGAAWSAAVHPFALYLAAGTLAIALVGVAVVWRRRVRPGQVAVWACIGYSAWRFLVEWSRDPATVIAVWGALNIHHLLAMIGLAAGLGVLAIGRKGIRGG